MYLNILNIPYLDPSSNLEQPATTQKPNVDLFVLVGSGPSAVRPGPAAIEST
jgi:hypothetical protein